MNAWEIVTVVSWWSVVVVVVVVSWGLWDWWTNREDED